jgi:hypothetical protein
MLKIQVGITNALRTGNFIFDIAIAMAVPMFFKIIMDLCESIKPRLHFLTRYFTREGDGYVRKIEYTKRTSSWGYDISDKEQRNNILQKAITMHLGARKDLVYKDAQISLTSITKAQRNDDDGDESSSTDPYGSTASQLKGYK